MLEHMDIKVSIIGVWIFPALRHLAALASAAAAVSLCKSWQKFVTVKYIGDFFSNMIS